MTRRWIVVSSLIAALLLPTASARAEHLVPFVRSAETCLPVNLVCTDVQMELRYQVHRNPTET
jgi:hypothetical protein